MIISVTRDMIIFILAEYTILLNIQNLIISILKITYTEYLYFQSDILIELIVDIKLLNYEYCMFEVFLFIVTQ